MARQQYKRHMVINSWFLDGMNALQNYYIFVAFESQLYPGVYIT